MFLQAKMGIKAMSFKSRLLFCAVFLAASSVFLALATTAAATVAWTMNINTNNVITVTDPPYNAVGNGSTDDTLAISNAIVQAAKGGNTNNLFGGTIRIPAPGIFLSGPLTFKNNVNIQIDGGAILRMLPLNLFTNYPSNGGDTYGNFLYASGLTNLEISGFGAIDGQGTPWWSASSAVFNNRPYLIYFNSGCHRVLLQNITISNAPAQNVVFKGKGGNFMLDGITEFEPPSSGVAVPSHNTDGLDLVGTNMLAQNCNISVGDDNIAYGTSSSGTPSSDSLVTNCAFGTGHGVSIGSNTQGGVSNLTVINCSFTGTDNGIRMKSDNNSSGGSGQGGITQNLSYLNLGMTNVGFPILIYSYYSEIGTPSSITPMVAATQAVETVTANTPIWRNIIFSNLTVIGGANCVIWSRTELPATNIVFSHVNISATKSFEIYNAGGVQFVDSQISGNSTTFQLFNAQVIVSNSAPTGTLFTCDGLTTNGFGNALSLYNAQASLKNTNVLDDGPLTISASTLTVSNNLALFPSTVLNYALGTNITKVAAVGNLALGGTINVTNNSGFTNGTYTLLTYTGTLSGNVPALGTKPAGYTYSFDTNTPGQVKLIVAPPAAGVPANLAAAPTNLAIVLTWSPSTNAAGYNLKRGTTSGVYPTIFSGLTSTNYLDAAVTNAVTYFYVVSATNAGGESANSLQASATPLPSNQPANIAVQAGGGNLQLSWPQDHLGWQLQIQTNTLSGGLGTNWMVVPDSQLTNQVFVPIDPVNGGVFLRLMYP